MISFLTIGIILGLSAGFSPGPLMTLVMSETLQHGIKSGIKVAVAPAICDLPIIMLTFFILAKLSGSQNVIGIISMIGGVLIAYMGYRSIRTKKVLLNIHANRSRALIKGVLVNLLNPNPYLFWLGVGAPTLIRAADSSYITAFLFISGFYGTLVGSKILLSVMVAKSRSFMNGKTYNLSCVFSGSRYGRWQLFFFAMG
jgi:threonine/homoserine/homoserine lactone efflux protein